MIVTRIYGGMGNQMFQFAAAYALALKNNTSLILDADDLNDRSEKKDFTYRVFALDAFELQKYIDKNPYRYYIDHPQGIVSRIKKKVFHPALRFHYEMGLNYDPSFKSLGKFVYLNGYFQSEEYFKEYGNEIRSAFTFHAFKTEKNILLKKEIEENNSVSIHIRRGDYVSNPAINKVHGSLSGDYYRNAINTLKQYVSDPVFYFFSDDPSWIRQQDWGIDNYKVIDHNSNPADDMCLMRSCKHQVIANSTFSWWGAWLNSFPEKRIIAPRNWFADPSRSNPDLIPGSWLKM